MVGEDHVLEQHRLLFRNPRLPGGIGCLLSPHDQVAQQLTLHGVVRHQAQLRTGEFLFLGKVMQQRPGQQQIPVDDRTILPGQKVRQTQHVPGVHQ